MFGAESPRDVNDGRIGQEVRPFPMEETHPPVTRTNFVRRLTVRPPSLPRIMHSSHAHPGVQVSGHESRAKIFRVLRIRLARRARRYFCRRRAWAAFLHRKCGAAARTSALALAPVP